MGITRWLALALLAAPLAVIAHGEGHKGARKEQPMVETEFGRTGDPKKATRTVRIDMSDKMRFTPDALEVRQGTTVRFIVKNSGNTMHEMVIGTLNELKDHAEVMKKHPGMEHDEPFMAHVPPGKTEEIVWQFTKPGEFHFGCLIPGHFEAGMVGKIKVVSK
jgi:uncharacterized cupredoxin-like copper-binding protein